MVQISRPTLFAQAQTCGCKQEDLYCIVIVDLKVPGAKSSETISELCSALQFANDLSPNKTVALLELPDQPKKASKRGLADEENEVQTCLWSLRQACDLRWICPFNVQPVAEAQTNRRQGKPLQTTKPRPAPINFRGRSNGNSWRNHRKF